MWGDRKGGGGGVFYVRFLWLRCSSIQAQIRASDSSFWLKSAAVYVFFSVLLSAGKESVKGRP